MIRRHHIQQAAALLQGKVRRTELMTLPDIITQQRAVLRVESSVSCTILGLAGAQRRESLSGMQPRIRGAFSCRRRRSSDSR